MKAYRTGRFVIVSALLILVGIPVLLYVLLSLPAVHQWMRREACSQLTELLGADVTIARASVEPFNRLELGEVAITLHGDTILTASELNAGISMRSLIFKRRIVVTDVELMRPDIRIWRDSLSAPLNVQPILDKLKGNGGNPPMNFDLAVHTVLLRSGRASYHVKDAEAKQTFDPNHIAISDLRADITAPKISNSEISVSLKRLNLRERSGLDLRNLAFDLAYTPEQVKVNGLQLSLEHTNLFFANLCLTPIGSRHLTDVEILEGSTLNPADLAPFFPPLEQLDDDIELSASAEVYADSLSIKSLSINSARGLLDAAIRANANAHSAESPALHLAFNGGQMAEAISMFKPLKPAQRKWLRALGDTEIGGSASWRKSESLELNMDIHTQAGNVSIDAELKGRRLCGTLNARRVNAGKLLPNQGLGYVTLSTTFDLSPQGGELMAGIDRLDWRGHAYRGINIDGKFSDKKFDVGVESTDTLAKFTSRVIADLTPGSLSGEIDAEIANFAPAEMGLWTKYPGYTLAGQINGEFTAEDPLHPSGQLRFTNLSFTDGDGTGLHEEKMALTADLGAPEQSISFTSGLIDITAAGSINIATIVPAVNNILAQALPETFTPKEIADGPANNITLAGTIHKDAPMLEFMKVPVKFYYDIELIGKLDEDRRQAMLSIWAPYIANGDKLIEKTKVTLTAAPKSTIDVITAVPSKFGLMELSLTSILNHGLGHATLRLNRPGEDAYSGALQMAYRPAADGVEVQIEESAFDLGEKDMTWTLPPALISAHGGRINIRNLTLSRPGQSLNIDGVVSKSPDDVLTVNLQSINLDNIFSALRMNPVVQFGGVATGTITGAGLLGAEPILQTRNNLHVRDLTYSHCLMGNAAISAQWNNEERGIALHADVAGNVAGGRTVVDGVIKPMTQELDFHFDAKHTPVGFLHTFMSTWADKVEGFASGNAHLWGTFKLVELEGNMLAENFALTVGFTNTTYYVTDSVHIRPGIIGLNDITLRDRNGHTAKLNGELTHEKFQNPKFNFKITDMRQLLAYDRPTSLDDFWGGTIYADGSVNIDGRPGHVGIDAIVATAPKSDFTIELRNNKSATEYNFLTFRDITPRQEKAPAQLRPGTWEMDQMMRDSVQKKNSTVQSASIYDFKLQVHITPEAKIVTVMDPVAGDQIDAKGSGDISIEYSTRTDEMALNGTYKLEEGQYNFTLQDIFRKNFNITSGSTITFGGNPYDAQLDIAATAQCHANLSDLDESFLTDKEVQHTSVLVNAVLLVHGSITAPEIDFDLQFPGFTNSDVPNKVKSIVNTPEMMQQQIIYLLALERFYTPEYMSATKGNELMSVASGTISSQLRNILGQLSDKVSVAPSLRSESSDFSDMEVNVALSSTLLNNRLLLNGNFGYRDNSLNTATTQFVGDLDVEYLLTRAGNWRLKAYNHFNDRNLYVKTALTTQGVGLMFKHDFDYLLQRKKNAKTEK